MKNFYTLFTLIILCLGVNFNVFSAPDGDPVVLAKWDFGDDGKKELITGHSSFVSNPYTADEGLVANKDIAEISLYGGAEFREWGAGATASPDQAPNTVKWDNSGSYWQISISTKNYTEISISSKQRGSNTGPKEFKIEYSIDNGSNWQAVGTTINVANNFTTGCVNDLALPSECDNLDNLLIRWLNVSNISVNGSTVASTGTSRIDDIIVKGVEIIIPEIIFSELEEEYFTNTDIEATATVVSNGYIDALCGINYQVYKDGEALEGDISEYGSLKYSFRDAGSDMYVGNLTEASGNLSIEVGEENVGAFSLGIFDTYCVNRNRNISFTANFTQPGLYKVEANLNSCSNTGDILEIGGFTANEICGGAYHNDLVAETCENPEVIESYNFEVKIIEEFIVGTPEIIFSELEEEYFTNTDIEATATVVSNGYIDALCGIDYQIYKDGIALEGDISEYGSLTYSFRDAGSDMYVGNLTEASGNLSIEVGEENVGAFSLGIFDTYCVNRNRDISFTVNFTQAGIYKVEANLNSCSNTGDILEIGGFTANEICGGAYHNDLVAQTCENPEVIESYNFEVKIIEYPVFTFIVNEIEYNDGDVIEVCYNSELEIELDYTPGSNIEFASESNIILSTTNDDPSESGNIFATLTVDESISENLTITISNSLTSYTTTYTLVVNALPIVDLGEDAIYCADESVVLEAPEAEYYLWSNDATTQSISITETGTYSVTITDANGCAGSDEIEITINPLPIVDLGEDISVEENQIFVLSVDETYAEYLWSTGETTNSIEVYGEVLGLGTHTISVTVTDFNTCTGSDQITITVTPTVEVLNGYVNTYTVYPNPTSGIINITGDNIISCVIFNNIGQIILETNNSEIDMSNYENGIYYVKILTDNDTKTIKFVKH